MNMIKVVVLLLTLNVFAQDLPLNLSSPRHTMNLFLKSMKAYKLGDSSAIDKAATAFNLESLREGVREVKGREYSEKLIMTLDKTAYVNIKEVPLESKHEIWIYRKQNLPIDDKIITVEISIAKNKSGEWLFTQATIDSLPTYEIYLQDKEVIKEVVKLNGFKQKIKEKLPKWVLKKKFLLSNLQWLGLLIVLILSVIFEKVIRIYLASKLANFLIKRHVDFTEKERKKLIAPFGLVSFAIAMNFLIDFLELPVKFLTYVHKGIDIIMAVAIILVMIQIVDVVCMYLQRKAKATENTFDDILVPLIQKTSRFFIYAVGIIFIGDALELNMKSILAGMGIGGIAFALAAKDTITNFFGSFTVLIDRPFTIGDWVVIDGKVEGTIEEVGLRSTRVRTAYDSQITVPNGSLTNANIDNYGRRKYRRLKTTLGVEYSTPIEKIEEFCEKVRQLVRSHPKTRKDYDQIYFNEFGASSLDIFFNIFLEVASRDEELQVRHEILVGILKIAEEMGVGFAFPTRTLHVFNEKQ
jgi:MscS family membrane protein